MNEIVLTLKLNENGNLASLSIRYLENIINSHAVGVRYCLRC